MSAIIARSYWSHALVEANTIIRRARHPQSWNIFPLKSLEDMVFLSPSDASQGSMPRGGSQAGFAVLVADPEIVQGPARCNLLETVSTRIKRTVRSCLAAEMGSASLALEHGEFARVAFADWRKFSARWALHLVIDAKTGFGVLQNETIPDDRRLAIDVTSLRETFQEDTAHAMVRWIPGPQHVAAVSRRSSVMICCFRL